MEATLDVDDLTDKPTLQCREGAVYVSARGRKANNDCLWISLDNMELDGVGQFSYQSYALLTASNSLSVLATLGPVSASDKIFPHNKLTCRERKHIIVSSTRRPHHIKKAMQLWLELTNRLLDPFREDNECWFHPIPPPPRLTSIGTLRPCGNIRKTSQWQDRHGKHSLVLNFGMVSKILFHAMTKL